MNRRGIGYHSARLVLAAVFGLGASVAAHAFEVTDQQREACEPDAFRLCSNEIPDIPRVTACMTANKSRLSPACRAVFNAMESGHATASVQHSEHKKHHVRVAERPHHYHHRHRFYADYER